MNTTEFLAELHTGRAEWEDALARIPMERMAEPGVEGKWSVKDVVAHIAWHEREMLTMLRARDANGSDLWNLPLDERNAAIYAQNRDRTLGDVLAEGSDSYTELLAAVENLSDEDLNDPKRYRDMPADWVPWQVLAGNTYEHYRDHAASLRKWLDRAG